MAEIAYESPSASRRNLVGPNWGAIWAGMFSFVGIWAVFGLLGEAIFASAANPNAAQPAAGGIEWGFSIWAIVLTGIAMFVGGRVTSRLSGATDRRDALMHGQTMFGLSVVAATILIVLSGAVLSGGTGVNTAATSTAGINALTGLGWAGFVSLLVGWLCVMWGSTAGTARAIGARNDVRNLDNIRDIRAA